MPRILKNEEIERIVDSRLSEYENGNGKISNLPIPIDRIIEDCNLTTLYDKIEEQAGETILAGLNIQKKRIVINESHMQLFREKPGLERSTKAHELGHWDIYVDKSKEKKPLLFDVDINSKEMSYRNSGAGRVSVLPDLWIDKDVYQACKIYVEKKDHPNVASAVDRYASSLLMPKCFIKDYTAGIDLTDWRNLYKIAEVFEVTISALCARLGRLGLVHIKDKKLYRTKEEVIGQNTFKFS